MRQVVDATVSLVAYDRYVAAESEEARELGFALARFWGWSSAAGCASQ